MRIVHTLLSAGLAAGALVAGAPAAAETFKPAVVSANLSPLESLWHLRAALNVAALGCRDADEVTTIAEYNALIHGQTAALAAAGAAVDAHYKAQYGASWQSALDRDMTRLYNYYAQPAAQAEFCATAKTVLAQVASVDPANLADFAVAEMPALDAPFWSPPQDQLAAADPAPAAVLAISAAVPVGPSGLNR
ncbi:MAG: hypothetical protein E7773_09180 [Sphingomonas sp.]|uniref:hypothetical protein n=1 Tax=Sphingomonas sp. TaxID=28214 RepID=UPI001224EA34|nr:hypothetical protein [Sphingomonas sp.]THD36097.1 MAG: hypothetical protein E7773_09180 [Sphingomonas sp.]